jgi:hypothetical protein
MGGGNPITTGIGNSLGNLGKQYGGGNWQYDIAQAYKGQAKQEATPMDIPGSVPNSLYKDPNLVGQGAGGILTQKAKDIQAGEITKDIPVQNPFTQALQSQLGLGQGAFVPNYAANQLAAGGGGALTGLVPQLQAEAAGTGLGATLGQRLLQQGLQQNVANVQSGVLSQRGLNPAMQAQMIAQQTANLGQQTAAQAGNLGFQQQLGAQQNLAGVGAQMAGLGSQQANAQAAANLGYLGALQGGFGQAQGLAAGTQLGQQQIQSQIAQANLAAQQANINAQRQLAGGILGGVAQAGVGGLLSQITGQAGGAGADVAAVYGGGRIDGEASKDGDNPQNDNVPAVLSPGEIVIPRSAAFNKEKAKKFLDSLDDWDEKASYTRVVKARKRK